MSTPNDPARSASVGEQRTPRAPARARLPLLPSGPGGFTGCTPHEGSPTTVVAELWAEMAAGQLESAAEDSPSWPRAHAWKACWGQPLASSNLASSATATRANAAPAGIGWGSVSLAVSAQFPSQLSWPDQQPLLGHWAPPRSGPLPARPRRGGWDR